MGIPELLPPFPTHCSEGGNSVWDWRIKEESSPKAPVLLICKQKAVSMKDAPGRPATAKVLLAHLQPIGISVESLTPPVQLPQKTK